MVIPTELDSEQAQKSNRRCFRRQRLLQYKGIADNISQKAIFIHSITKNNYTPLQSFASPLRETHCGAHPFN